VVQLRLNKNYSYTLDLQQDDFTTRDFIIGEGGGNDINIIQK
jgi:hypothetical protein